MKEFMLLIRNAKGHKEALAKEIHSRFLQECEDYIAMLKSAQKLIAAQPIAREGLVISGTNEAWSESPFDANGTVWVGYYHIKADDLDDAINIARQNPEFKYGTTASIEVRPIKMKEESTGFVYPR